MATDSELKKKQSRDQKAIIGQIICAFILMFCLGLTAFYYPFPKPRLPTMMAKLVFTMRWLSLSCATVVAGVVWVANTRFLTPAMNPLDKNADKYVSVASRYLQNTVEQFLLHSSGLAVLSTHLPEDKMCLIPLLVVLYIAARVLFAVGYMKSYLYRGIGFSLTFNPTVFVHCYNIYCSFAYGFAPPTH